MVKLAANKKKDITHRIGYLEKKFAALDRACWIWCTHQKIGDFVFLV